MRLLEGDLDELYDWCTDVMSDSWDPALVRTKWRTSRELQDHLAVSNVRDNAMGSNMAMDDSSFAHSNPASPSPTSPGMAATQLPAQAGIVGSH